MTPIKDSYNARIELLDADIKLDDLSKLTVGDFIYAPRVRGSITGFVKKVARVHYLNGGV